MKGSLNSHVNDSNFSVVFDSRVKDGAQCCMFLQLWNQVYSRSLLAALMMLDAQRQLHECKNTVMKLTYTCLRHHTTQVPFIWCNLVFIVEITFETRKHFILRYIWGIP